MEGGIHVIMMVFYMRYFHYLRSHDNIVKHTLRRQGVWILSEICQGVVK